MAVYGYVRVSTLQQAHEGESLGQQQRQIDGYCLMHGLTLEAMFIERGVSGSKPLGERPEGRRLLKGLQRGDVVIAAKLDRVFRSALDALQMTEAFKQDEISLHLIDLGGDIAGHGLAKLFLTISAAFAEAERDRIRERIITIKADQRLRGRHLGGSRPFGYEVDQGGGLLPLASEQAAIRHMAELRRQGLSLRAIAEAVEREHGHRLSHVAVKRVLRDASREDGHQS